MCVCVCQGGQNPCAVTQKVSSSPKLRCLGPTSSEDKRQIHRNEATSCAQFYSRSENTKKRPGPGARAPLPHGQGRVEMQLDKGQGDWEIQGDTSSKVGPGPRLVLVLTAAVPSSMGKGQCHHLTGGLCCALRQREGSDGRNSHRPQRQVWRGAGSHLPTWSL